MRDWSLRKFLHNIELESSTRFQTYGPLVASNQKHKKSTARKSSIQSIHALMHVLYLKSLRPLLHFSRIPWKNSFNLERTQQSVVCLNQTSCAWGPCVSLQDRSPSIHSSLSSLCQLPFDFYRACPFSHRITRSPVLAQKLCGPPVANFSPSEEIALQSTCHPWPWKKVIEVGSWYHEVWEHCLFFIGFQVQDSCWSIVSI